MLRLGFRLLWRHVESERARMFALGESRLNHRKARKHHWFTRVGRAFSVWRRAARQALESRLRIALLLRKKRVSLLHEALIIKWRPYTNALRALLQRKLNRALAYWRNSGMMRAFMGWRAAVARGLALRAALRISHAWMPSLSRLQCLFCGMSFVVDDFSSCRWPLSAQRPREASG